jgi:hypothetical protein
MSSLDRRQKHHLYYWNHPPQSIEKCSAFHSLFFLKPGTKSVKTIYHKGWNPKRTKK